MITITISNGENEISRKYVWKNDDELDFIQLEDWGERIADMVDTVIKVKKKEL